MALRFYLPFTSLKLAAATDGEHFRAELWDSAHSGGATEVTGTPEGLRIEWEGESDVPSAIMASSATFSILIEQEADMVLINALVGAAEGRFKMVVRRAGSSEVYWAGWVHADDCSYPDQFYPFHFEIFATDGIGRLKDVDYDDDGDWYVGEDTVLQHIINIVGKIGTTDVGTWPEARFRSTANWFSNGMNTTTCPLHQAMVNYDAFEKLDNKGNKTPWNAYAVLDALLRPFNVQLLHEGGMFHLRQIGIYQDATQKAYYYDAAGDLLSTATEDVDRTVDYATAGEMVKLAGGINDALPALKKVCVDYHHLTSNDKGQGQFWNTGDETYHTLPGAVVVDTAGETFLRCALKIRHKSNVVVIPANSQPYPDHRLRFSIQIRMEDGTNPGHYYYLRRVAGANTPFFDIQPSEMEWYVDGPDNFKIWAVPINDFDNNIEKELSLAFTSPSLPTEVSGSKIQMKIDLLGAEKTNGGDITIDGVTLQGGFTWYTNLVSVRIEDEGGGEDGSNDIERTCAEVDNLNTQKRLLDIYLGDGPAPFSLSTFRVGSTPTATWKINNTGTGKPIAQLMAEQVLRFRKVPQKLYRGTFLHPLLRPWTRFIDQDVAYMATRISLSAFENRWSGDFVVMDGDVDGIVNTQTTHEGPQPPHLPGPPTGPTIPDIPGGISLPPSPPFPPFDGLGGGTLPGYVSNAEHALVKLSTSLLASDFNTDRSLPITNLPYAFARKGDRLVLINPINGHRETFYVGTSYVPGATSIAMLGTDSDMVKDFPAGTLIKLHQPDMVRVKGWSYFQENQTGEYWTIPSPNITDPATAGPGGQLPSASVYDEATLRERIEVWRGNNRVFYRPTANDGGFALATSNRIRFWLPLSGEDVYLLVR